MIIKSKVAVMAASVAVCTAAAAQPALATASGDYYGSGVSIRTGPTTSNTILGYGYAGQGVRIDCYAQGTWVGVSNVWYHHRNVTTQVLGYSAAEYIWRNGGTVYKC
jgi:uncharacterized protein YraI